MASAASAPLTIIGIGGGPVLSSPYICSFYLQAAAEAACRQVQPGPVEIVLVLSAKMTAAEFAQSLGWIQRLFGTISCRISLLHQLDDPSPDLRRARVLLDNADLIVFSGGNILSAIAYLETTGLAVLLDQAVSRGVVAVGESAGLIAWFAGGHFSDRLSDESAPFRYGIARTLGVLPTGLLCCPHASDNARIETRNMAYPVELTRRDDFVCWLRYLRQDGLAVDNDTAVFICGLKILVMGSGVVTTHRWKGEYLYTSYFSAGQSFPLHS